MDHPFIDGNKRIAAKVLDMGLDMNGILLKATNEEVIKEFLDLAAGKSTIRVSSPESIQKSDLLKFNIFSVSEGLIAFFHFLKRRFRFMTMVAETPTMVARPRTIRVIAQAFILNRRVKL